MPSMTTLQLGNLNIIWPGGLLGWLGWFALLAVLFWGVRLAWTPGAFKNLRWGLLAAFIALTPFATFLMVAQLSGSGIPLPNMPGDAAAPVLIMFFALPWVLAAGFLGVIPAALVGLISGIILSLWGTHNLFTPIEITGLALVFAMVIRQPYRTTFYRLLRQPLIAVLAVGIIFLPFYLLSSFFTVNGSIAVRMDYALTQSWLSFLARIGELLIAGIVAQILLLFPTLGWYRPAVLQPSPTESSLSWRFFFSIMPLVIITALVLTLGDWWVAGSAARQMINGRMSSAAEVAAKSLPYFLESGQTLVQNYATPDLIPLSPQTQADRLADQVRLSPYFRQMVLVDSTGAILSGYPESRVANIKLAPEELMAVQLALQGVPIQTYAIPAYTQPADQNPISAQISFISPIQSETGQMIGVLIGRTDLVSNPYTQPAIEAMQTIAAEGGEGMILDENQRILYDTLQSPELVMSSYIGQPQTEAAFFEDVSASGTRQLVYYQPGEGRPWAIVLTMPAEGANQLALKIAIPLLLILALFVVVAYSTLRLTLRSITGSLGLMANQSVKIAQGHLDNPMKVRGVDEIGRLGTSFEQMRISLKARLEELNRLLVVSQGVANLEVGEAVSAILEAALGPDSNSARIVLIRDVMMETHESPWVSFGAGPATEAYAYLDKQIFDLMRHQDLLPIPNTLRVRRVAPEPGQLFPGALIALPLYYENYYYGVLWVGYESPHNFSESEVRFLSTLSSEAAVAAVNARLYATSEIGRQRLEAVLASTPEPVLVFDEKDRLFLVNPAVLQVPGLIASAMPGQPASEVVLMPELLDLLQTPPESGLVSRELALQNGRIYYASVSPVIADGRQVGKICMLRDITHFKELDTLKSDFVSTVSHDLRSPLTLMRGYATMLQMVGELNEQQQGYVKKMIGGVDNMTRLVNNLLDLGRIEAGIDLRLENIRANEIVSQVVALLQPQAAQKNIQIVSELPEDGPVVIEADSALLQQSIYNLVENAIKYTPVGGRVRVHLQARAETILFSVIDTGIGIAPLDLPRLFEKFYRSGRREAYQQHGTGLGLAIVKSIADRHGGRVWVESQLGKGSAFFFEIPREQPAAKKPKQNPKIEN